MSHQHANQNSNRKITLKDAMEQLTAMFPDIPPDLIKQSLYSTKGYMERTVEILLHMQERGGHVAAAPSPQSEFPDEQGVAHTLQADFLRSGGAALRSPHPPSYGSFSSSSEGRAHGARSRQEIQDEKMARDLQRHLELEQNLVRAGLGMYDVLCANHMFSPIVF